MITGKATDTKVRLVDVGGKEHTIDFVKDRYLRELKRMIFDMYQKGGQIVDFDIDEHQKLANLDVIMRSDIVLRINMTDVLGLKENSNGTTSVTYKRNDISSFFKETYTVRGSILDVFKECTNLTQEEVQMITSNKGRNYRAEIREILTLANKASKIGYPVFELESLANPGKVGLVKNESPLSIVVPYSHVGIYKGGVYSENVKTDGVRYIQSFANIKERASNEEIVEIHEGLAELKRALEDIVYKKDDQQKNEESEHEK